MAAGEGKSGNVLTRPDVRNCAGLMLVALVPRLFHIWLSPVMSRDCYQYIEIARLYAAGDFVGAVAEAPLLPPLMTMTMAGLHRLGFSLAAAGLTLGLVANLAVLPLLYNATKRFFDARAAVYAALLYALHPIFIRYSADILRDNLSLGLFAWAVWLVYTALDAKPCGWRWVVAGVLCGLAVCNRKEAWELPFCLFAYLCVRALAARAMPSRQTLFGVLLFVASLAAVCLPTGMFMARHGALWQPVDTEHLVQYVLQGWWRDASRIEELQN